MEDIDQFDGLFMTVMQKSGGINNFFESMFGFLYRKSDYFADPSNAWSFVEKNYQKYQKKYDDRKEKESKKKKKEEEEKKSKLENHNIKQTASVKEVTPEEYERKKKLEEEKRLNPTTTTETESKDKDEEERNKIAEGKVKPGKGNGGKTERYEWEQRDIKEITITIPVPSDVSGKNITFKYDAKTIFVQVKDEKPIIDGEFCSLIKPDSLVWALDEEKGKKFIVVTFEKFNNMNWWEQLIKNDGDVIDTTKINPEASKISDIEDPEMKAKIEQLMFDTQQKAQGLPTSEELKNRDMMGNFMKAHPEMDFSKCKFG